MVTQLGLEPGTTGTIVGRHLPARCSAPYSAFVAAARLVGSSTSVVASAFRVVRWNARLLAHGDEAAGKVSLARRWDTHRPTGLLTCVVSQEANADPVYRRSQSVFVVRIEAKLSSSNPSMKLASFNEGPMGIRLINVILRNGDVTLS